MRISAFRGNESKSDAAGIGLHLIRKEQHSPEQKSPACG